MKRRENPDVEAYFYCPADLERSVAAGLILYSVPCDNYYIFPSGYCREYIKCN